MTGAEKGSKLKMKKKPELDDKYPIELFRAVQAPLFKLRNRYYYYSSKLLFLLFL